MEKKVDEVVVWCSSRLVELVDKLIFIYIHQVDEGQSQQIKPIG